MGQPVMEQGAWRFYTDATPDGSMVALAAEDTAPTLTQAQMENGIIRLRVQLCETGGSKGLDSTVEIQWSPDNSSWGDIGAQATPDGAQWVFWANGAATGGNTIGSQLLTGTATSGNYHETADQAESVGISDTVEIDCALRIQWPVPDDTIYLRVNFGSALSPKSGSVAITFNTSTAANRSYTIAAGPDVGGDNSLRGGMNPKVFYDGTYWWAFWIDDNDTTKLNYFYWSGSGSWSSVTTTTFTNAIAGSYNVALWMEVLGSTPVVMVIYNTGGGNATYKRGTISGTTISWGSETSLGATGTNDDTSLCIDDGGYWWILEAINATGVRARRSTNADSGSSWSAGWNSTHSASDTSITGGDLLRIVGLASNKALAVWHSGTALKWALVDDTSGFGTVNTLVSTAQATDWGLARTGGYVYLVHTDATGSSGNWVLRVFSESTDTWSSGTSPSVSGQGTSDDGLAVIASGSNDIYCIGSFTYDSYNNRKLAYKKYAGPGTSGTWDSSTTDLTPDEARGNGDFLSGCPEVDGGKLVVAWIFNDCDLGTSYPMTFEYHTLSVGPSGITVTPASGYALDYGTGPTVVLGSTSVTPASGYALDYGIDPTVVLGSTSVTPASGYALSYGVDPTVVLGSLSLSPASGYALSYGVDPTVLFGGIVVTPTSGYALDYGIDPTVLLGSISVTPASGYALSYVVDPTVVLGSTSVTPASGYALSYGVDPTVLFGGIVVTPASGYALDYGIDPTVVLGSTSVTPASGYALSYGIDPTVVLGSTSVTPASGYALDYGIDPTVVLGSLSLSPASGYGLSYGVDPTVLLGSTSVTPASGYALSYGVDPTVLGEGITVTPASGYALDYGIDPTVLLGSTSVTPASGYALSYVVDPTVVLGSLSLSPASGYALDYGIDPTVVLGSVSITPSSGYALDYGIDPTVLLGSTSVTPASGYALSYGVDPTVGGGGTIVSPASGYALDYGIDPTVLLGSTSVTPASGYALSYGIDPTALLGSTSVTPASGYALSYVVDPTVVLGSLSLSPASGYALDYGIDPTVVLGGLSITPAAGYALGYVIAPTVILGSTSVTPASGYALSAGADPWVVLSSIVITPGTGHALSNGADPSVTIAFAVIISMDATSHIYDGDEVASRVLDSVNVTSRILGV